MRRPFPSPRPLTTILTALAAPGIIAAVAGAAALRPAAADAAPVAQDWYWSQATMTAAVRADYSYDPALADPYDPWHYELSAVDCKGFGPFHARAGARYFKDFACTLTLRATDASVADYVQRMTATVTGADEHEEADPPGSTPAGTPAAPAGRVISGYRTWDPVIDDQAPGLLRSPESLLLLGPDRVLADSPHVSHIRWHGWGSARAVGTGRSRTKGYDPWSKVRLVASAPRTCGGSTAYTRITATFTTGDHGRTYTGHGSWTLPCGVRLR